MSRRMIFAILLATTVLTRPGQAIAIEENEGFTGCTAGTDGGGVDVGCVDPGSSGDDTTPTRPVGVTGPMTPCTWTAATAADGWDPTNYGSGVVSTSGYVFGTTGDNGITRTFPNGRTEQVYAWQCPNGTTGSTWVDTSIRVQDVIDDAVGRARRAVPTPKLDLSPAPEAGGIVNLGLWLALTAQDPVTVRAEAGNLWAEATVTLASTTWDMGNGDVIECDGAGTPIVDTETMDEGPCGYTYRTSSPNDDPYKLTVTATWTVTYRSSAGPGTVAPVERTLSVDYDVDEIQTVGVSN